VFYQPEIQLHLRFDKGVGGAVDRGAGENLQEGAGSKEEREGKRIN